MSWRRRLSSTDILRHINTLRPRQCGRHFLDNILIWIFLNENVWIWCKISLRFIPKDPINNISALVQIMDWCPTKQATSHYLEQWYLDISITWPQCVNLGCIPSMFFLLANQCQWLRKNHAVFLAHWSLIQSVNLIQIMTWYLSCNKPLLKLMKCVKYVEIMGGLVNVGWSV